MSHGLPPGFVREQQKQQIPCRGHDYAELLLEYANLEQDELEILMAGALSAANLPLQA